MIELRWKMSASGPRCNKKPFSEFKFPSEMELSSVSAGKEKQLFSSTRIPCRFHSLSLSLGFVWYSKNAAKYSQLENEFSSPLKLHLLEMDC